MTEKVIQPRCPKCNRLQANSVIEGDFTCQRCGTHFIITSEYVQILTSSRKIHLTKETTGVKT